MLEDMLGRSRSLRANMSNAENRLWYFLRDRRLKGYKFNRQQVIGPYIVDFVCRKKKIIIELDGGQHNDNEIRTYDNSRTQFLKIKGYTVLRFWNQDIFNKIHGVLENILQCLEN